MRLRVAALDQQRRRLGPKLHKAVSRNAGRSGVVEESPGRPVVLQIIGVKERRVKQNYPAHSGRYARAIASSHRSLKLPPSPRHVTLVHRPVVGYVAAAYVIERTVGRLRCAGNPLDIPLSWPTAQF